VTSRAKRFLHAIESNFMHGNLLRQSARLLFQAREFGTVLDAHEEQNRDAHEEDEVRRQLDADETRRPLESRREDSHDQGKHAGYQPPDCVSFSKTSAPQHFDHNSKRDQRCQYAEYVTCNCHAASVL